VRVETLKSSYCHNFPLQQHLKKVTEQFPDDVEAWIELAQILERSDVQVCPASMLYLSVKQSVIYMNVTCHLSHSDW